MAVSTCLGPIWAVLLTGCFTAQEFVVTQPQEEKEVLAQAEPLTTEGLNLYKAGKYREAEPLFVRALAIKEKIFGPEHPETAASLNDLAEVLRKLAQFTRAEP